jgi:acetyl-CoA carboxylase biotin carboxyl carrier protein
VSLTAADVAEIMRLVEQSNFDELTLEVDGIKLNLKRGNAVTATPSGFASPAHVTPPTLPATVATVTPTVLDPDTHEVSSPLLGTFYRAPKPGAPPFVEAGSAVEPDTVIGIIEVMKLMNTVRAGVRGTVTEILVSDGALVEYEQTLMRIRKTG